MKISELKELKDREMLVKIIPLEDESANCKFIIFTLPKVREDGFYRSVMSFNGFFNGKRNWKGRKNKRFDTGTLFLKRDKLDVKVDVEVTAKTGFSFLYSDKSKDEEILVVNSIWDFYKVIGYNYKTKKWTN